MGRKSKYVVSKEIQDFIDKQIEHRSKLGHSKKRLRNFEYYLKRKILGICVMCSNKAEIGKVRCGKCLTINKNYVKNKRKENIKNNICRDCWTPLNKDSDIDCTTRCRSCLDRQQLYNKGIGITTITCNLEL